MRAKIFLGAACLLTVLLGGYAYYTQAARQNAPVFYFEMAPVDPRAMLSGDYMALSYELENAARADLRGRGTLTFYAAPNSVVQAGNTKRPVKIAYHGRRFKLPHQFYFQEGTGQKYENAAYAQMRRLPGGRFLIDALTDENFNEIK